MTAADQCPPLYVPTRSECNAVKEQSKQTLLAAGLNPQRWQLDAMGCSCGSHIEDVPAMGQRLVVHLELSPVQELIVCEPPFGDLEVLARSILAGRFGVEGDVDARRDEDPASPLIGIKREPFAATPGDNALDDKPCEVGGPFIHNESLSVVEHACCHDSSPSVGAPSGAVCDNPNPTDGELNPGAASSPNRAAPAPTETEAQE